MFLCRNIWESNEGEAILSRRRVAALISVWSMRPLLNTEVRREREGERSGSALQGLAQEVHTSGGGRDFS
jgi:hypothetical protein